MRTLHADLGSSPGCTSLVEEVVTELGGLDVLVHSVGMNQRTPVLETTDDEWQQITELNLSSTFGLGRAAGRVMCEQGYGRQVHFSSVAGLMTHSATARTRRARAG